MAKGLLSNVTSAEIASLLSCFVCKGKHEDSGSEWRTFSGAWLDAKSSIVGQIEEVALMYALRQQVHMYARRNLDVENVSCQWGMAEIVYEVALGSPLSSLVNSASAPAAGDIVACLRRLVDLMNEVIDVAVALRDNQLASKLRMAIKTIREDEMMNGLILSETS